MITYEFSIMLTNQNSQILHEMGIAASLWPIFTFYPNRRISILVTGKATGLDLITAELQRNLNEIFL